MSGWLERAKNDYLHRRLSRHDLEEIHDAAVKAAIKDQEAAGVDVVSDGELRRDNMIDHFTTRLPGVQIDHGVEEVLLRLLRLRGAGAAADRRRSGWSRSSGSSGASPSTAPRCR